MKTPALLRAALAASLVSLAAGSAGCADANAAPLRPAPTAAELEARQHLDTVITVHLKRIRGDLARAGSARSSTLASAR